MRALVRQLRGETAAAASWTLARIILNLAATAEESRAAKQYGPAVRAYELMGRHLGMFGPADMAPTTVNVAVSTAVQQLDVETLRALAARYDALDAAPAAIPPLMLGDAVYMDSASDAQGGELAGAGVGGDAPLPGQPEA